MNDAEFEEWKVQKAQELFEKRYPATCRKPSGEKWAFKESQTLQLIHETIDATRFKVLDESALDAAKIEALILDRKDLYSQTTELRAQLALAVLAIACGCDFLGASGNSLPCHGCKVKALINLKPVKVFDYNPEDDFEDPWKEHPCTRIVWPKDPG